MKKNCTPSHSALRSLLSTTEDEHAVAELLDTEVSRRLLPLRAVLDAAGDGPEAGAASVRETWRLLEAAEKLEPARFHGALFDPQVGLWAARMFRRLSGVVCCASGISTSGAAKAPRGALPAALSRLGHGPPLSVTTSREASCFPTSLVHKVSCGMSSMPR